MIHPDTLRIISVIAFLVFFVAGLKRPIWATVAYMILVNCKISGYYPVFANIQSETVFALIILVRIFFSKDSFRKLSPRYDPVNKYLLIFIGTVLLSFLFSLNMQVSWDNGIYHFIKVLVLFSMILGSIKNEQDIKIFVWSFLVMFTYLAYEPVYGFLTGTGASWYSYGEVYTSEMGALSGHVALANNMNQCIPIVFFLIPGIKNKILRSLGISIIIILFFALVASKSRSGVAGLIVFAGCAAYFSKKRMRNAIAIGMACALIFILSGSLKSTAGRINLSIVKSRLTGLIHGIEMIRIKGHILGVGPGCFSFARKAYFDYRLESHNIYGELIGDLGIPGTIAWFFLIRQIFINLITSKKKLKQISMENHFLFRLAAGLQVSLFVRLFIAMASHGLYYFYWYVIAALSIMTLKMTERISLKCFINQEVIEVIQGSQKANNVPTTSL